MKAENICVMTDSDPIARSPTLSQAPGSPWRTWCVLVVVSFGLYACTANRGAQWQDSGVHLLRVVTHEAVNPLGLALSHPLHHWLSRTAVALDVLEPSFVMTLVSGLAAAIAQGVRKPERKLSPEGDPAGVAAFLRAVDTAALHRELDRRHALEIVFEHREQQRL
ncbi:MAG: hypothetical protein IID35_07055, partial [Planctomycetes bacterium]|nr:hypothetical protein [Planctomycetota bacterium]